MSTDPTALTREVLDAVHEDETITVCTIPDNKVATLARAVIRVEALADRLERLATWERTPPAGPPASSPYADGLDEAAARIRTTLNGGNA